MLDDQPKSQPATRREFGRKSGRLVAIFLKAPRRDTPYNAPNAAEVAEGLRRLLGVLDDETLRRLAVLRMDGCSNEEIADRLRRGLRLVERKLAINRMTWEWGRV